MKAGGADYENIICPTIFPSLSTGAQAYSAMESFTASKNAPESVARASTQGRETVGGCVTFGVHVKGVEYSAQTIYL